MKKPDYPHTKPGLGDPPWINAILYAIAGWMVSWYLTEDQIRTEQHATAFGGYFKVFDDGQLRGELIDTFGNAKIKGKLTAEELSFTKTYVHLAHYSISPWPINYHFEKAGEVWKGYFTFESGTSGAAECAINPAIHNAFGIVTGPIRCA